MENRVLPYKAKPRGNFPHAKRIGDFILVSGTSARQQDDTFPGVVQGAGSKTVLDMRRQTHAALHNIVDIVESFGAKREDIVEIQAFLVSMKDYEIFNEVYGEYFDYSGPTRTTVAVNELPHPHQLLMLKAMAYFPV
jgi:2-aminomuconate deaminase